MWEYYRYSRGPFWPWFPQFRMDKLIELSHTEIVLAFAAFCIESTARRLGKSYQEVYQRMKKVRMIDDYIIPCYDALHTQSRERVTDDMIEYLNNKEALQ